MFSSFIFIILLLHSMHLHAIFIWNYWCNYAARSKTLYHIGVPLYMWQAPVCDKALSLHHFRDWRIKVDALWLAESFACSRAVSFSHILDGFAEGMLATCHSIFAASSFGCVKLFPPFLSVAQLNWGHATGALCRNGFFSHSPTHLI